MTASWGLQPAPKKTRGPRFWIALAVAVVVLILLLIAAPAVVAFLAVLALVFALVVLLIGRARWARIPHRKAAAGVAGGTLVLIVVAASLTGPSETATTPAADAAAQESPAPSAEPELASFVGEACEGDQLVMTQDGQSNYCDANEGGSFVWVAAADHEKSEAAAVALASQQAADEAKAEKAAAAKEAARTKAAAQAKAEKAAAAMKAAEKKAAAQAQAKKAEQQESARKAQAAQAARAAEKRAADKAAAARKQSYVAQPAAPKKPASTSAYYKNCTAVRAAGADPIHVGDPGYSRKLDRDGDGVGCE